MSLQNEKIYTQLENVLPFSLDLNFPEYFRMIASTSSMDLVVERLHPESQYLPGGVDASSQLTLSLAHYFEQNGDLCQDPEMVVRVDTECRFAEALMFQQAIPPVYDLAYPEPHQICIRARLSMNAFLGNTWLPNLSGGYKLQEESVKPLRAA